MYILREDNSCHYLSCIDNVIYAATIYLDASHLVCIQRYSFFKRLYIVSYVPAFRFTHRLCFDSLELY
jgi:squalene cyclase